MEQPQKVLELEFTIIEFYSNYVISVSREGTVLGSKQVADLVEVCSDYYRNRYFIYLSYRINDYNVNPTVYLDLEEVKNLAAIGIISKKSSSLNMAKFEKNFCKLPFEIFTDLDEALEWTQAILKEKSKKADL